MSANQQSSSPDRAPQARRRPSLLAPAVVLSLFAVTIPAPLARTRSGVSNAACLTLAERAVGQPDRPLALLEQCSALHPGDVELLADLGAAHEPVDGLKAEAAYRRALALDPGYAELRLRLGRLLLRRHATVEAAREAQAGLQVQPNRQALLDLLADARAQGKRR